MKTPKSFRTGAFSKRRGKLLNILIHKGTMSKNSTKIGYVKMYRSFFENELYFAEPFSRMSAWIDLLLLANHKDTPVIIKGQVFNLKKGQLAYSVKTLAARWQWSRSKVDRYLDLLQNRTQIEHQKKQPYNYHNHNKLG